MKLLYILKGQPTQSTETLMEMLGRGKEISRYNLYEEQDYDKLVEMIFANEEIISWW